MRKLRRWIQLPAPDRCGVLEAWLALLLVEVALRHCDLKRAQGLLAKWARIWQWRSPAPPEEGRLGKWVAMAAANHLGSPRCLNRSLALQAMLLRRHRETVLRLGVRRRGARLEAHAWLERGGAPLPTEIAATRGYRMLRAAGAGS